MVSDNLVETTTNCEDLFEPQEEDLVESIFLVRIRHFVEFDTPLILRRTEEITFFNESKDSINQIIYNAREFLPHLHIYDTNGEQLIFHGDIENELRPTTGLGTQEQNIERPIFIELPKNREVKPSEFKTITLKYINDFGMGAQGLFKLPIGCYPRFYLCIKKMDEYETEIFPYIESNGKKFNLSNLKENPFIQIIDTPSSLTISSSISIPNCKLAILTTYKLHTRDQIWFNGGIIIGAGAFFTNLLLITWDPKCFLPMIITLGAISNTYLILTKGWIFTKTPVERILQFPYTSIYFWLILSIFIEIFLACLFAISMTDFNQNINISSTFQVLTRILTI